MVFASRRRAHSPDLDETEEELVADLASTEELDVELDDATNQDLARRSEELEADLLEDLKADEELEEDLDEEHEADEELEEDADDELEVGEEELSTCAPYLARQMSCLGSRTPGVKDTPFLGSVWGVEEAEELLPPGGFARRSRSTY